MSYYAGKIIVSMLVWVAEREFHTLVASPCAGGPRHHSAGHQNHPGLRSGGAAKATAINTPGTKASEAKASGATDGQNGSGSLVMVQLGAGDG